MRHPYHHVSGLLLAASLLALTTAVNFFVKPAFAVPKFPFECDKPPDTPVISWCENIQKKWYRTPDFQCEGEYKGGGKPTKEDFARILEHHAEWLAAYEPAVFSQEAIRDNRKANLCGADLRGVEIRGVNLRWADLQGVNLTGKSLTGINLEDAHLKEAILIGATLGGANLRTYMDGVNLCGAHLGQVNIGGKVAGKTKLNGLYDVNATYAVLSAELQGSIDSVNLCGAYLGQMDLSGGRIKNSNLSGATLDRVDLSKAIIDNVDFRRARLDNVNLHAATVSNVDVTNAVFSPTNVEGLFLIGAEGLSSIILSGPAGQSAAVILRKKLKESGLRKEEKALTSALRKFARRTEPTYVRVFETVVLGGWITDYGAQPWWSLISLVAGIPVFSLLYMLALRTRGHAGIWAVWPPDRIQKEQTQEVEQVTGTFFSPRLHLWSGRKWHERVWQRLQVPRQWRCFRVLLIGLYFSLLSAFHIGWRELNVGTWITRLQPREYTLRATGWVRTVSGFQSLLSVYFLALWALTYFGRPFE